MGMMAARRRVFFQSLHGVKAGGEKPGEEEDENELGDLRGLEGEESAEADPAMGVVGVAKEEDHDQEHGGDGECGVDEARRFVAVVVHAHEGDHGEDAGESPEGLAAYEGVGGVVAVLCDDGGGGEDHGEADHHEEQSGEEYPFVDAYAFCHCSPPHGRRPVRGAPDFRLIISAFIVSRADSGESTGSVMRTKVINSMNWRRWSWWSEREATAGPRRAWPGQNDDLDDTSPGRDATDSL